MVQMPDMLNWFGWCTWDAFYTDVTSEGLKQGLGRYCFSHYELSLMLSFYIEDDNKITPCIYFFWQLRKGWKSSKVCHN